MFSHVIVSQYNSDQHQKPKAIDFVADVAGGGGLFHYYTDFDPLGVF